MDEESGPKIQVQIVSEIPYAPYAISWLLVARMRVTLKDKWDMRHVTTGRQTEHFNCLVKYFDHNSFLSFSFLVLVLWLFAPFCTCVWLLFHLPPTCFLSFGHVILAYCSM